MFWYLWKLTYVTTVNIIIYSMSKGWRRHINHVNSLSVHYYNGCNLGKASWLASMWRYVWSQSSLHLTITITSFNNNTIIKYHHVMWLVWIFGTLVQSNENNCKWNYTSSLLLFSLYSIMFINFMICNFHDIKLLVLFSAIDQHLWTWWLS